MRQIDSAQQCDEGNPQRDEALRQIALSLLRQIALSLKRIDISSTPILLDHFAGKREQLEFPLENPIFHASVVRYRNEYLFLSRSFHFLMNLDKQFHYASTPHRSIPILHRFDASLKQFESAIVNDAQLRRSCASAEFGIEDARVFVWRDAVWGIAAGISPAPHGGLKATQILFRMDGSDIVEFHELQSPNKSNMEKNWVPLVADDTLYLLYGICPYVVFAYEDGQLKAIRGPGAQDNKFALRGSSQFIPVKEKYVGVCHFERNEVEDKYYYRHVFVIINKHLDLEQISEPFFIQRKGVEFCCGLSRYDDGLLLSYGVMKLNSAFCLVPFSELSKWIVV